MNFIERQLAFVTKYWHSYISGVGVTLLLSFIGVLIGSILGIFICLMRLNKNKAIRFVSTGYVEIIRGTPMVVQLLIIYMGLKQVIPPSMTMLRNSIFLCSIAICINTSAYISEIIRGGIISVDKGQAEAGRCLGLTEKQTMRKIIFPQAFKTILPSLGNEFITLIKETAIVMTVGVTDLTYRANVIKGATFEVVRPLVYAALLYFILTFTLSKVLGRVERRLAND